METSTHALHRMKADALYLSVGVHPCMCEMLRESRKNACKVSSVRDVRQNKAKSRPGLSTDNRQDSACLFGNS